MKIARHIIVSLEQEGEPPAKLKFTRDKLNDFFRQQEEVSAITDSVARSKFIWKHITEKLVEIKDLFDEDGKTAITVEDFKNLDLPIDTMNGIIEAYNLQLSGKKQSTEEKVFTQG